MDIAIQVALITACFGVVTAALTFLLKNRAERRDTLQERKRQHYFELLSALSDFESGHNSDEAEGKFVRAMNMLVLVAPQVVVSAALKFCDEIVSDNPGFSQESHDKKLKDLTFQLRQSLELPFKDDPETFEYRLVGGAKIEPERHSAIRPLE